MAGLVHHHESEDKKEADGTKKKRGVSSGAQLYKLKIRFPEVTLLEKRRG